MHMRVVECQILASNELAILVWVRRILNEAQLFFEINDSFPNDTESNVVCTEASVASLSYGVAAAWCHVLSDNSNPWAFPRRAGELMATYRQLLRFG